MVLALSRDYACSDALALNQQGDNMMRSSSVAPPNGPIAAPALLVLEDGTTFAGHSIGALGEAFGELVFNTGMTGYQEVLTDPRTAGRSW